MTHVGTHVNANEVYIAAPCFVCLFVFAMGKVEKGCPRYPYVQYLGIWLDNSRSFTHRINRLQSKIAFHPLCWTDSCLNDHHPII